MISRSWAGNHRTRKVQDEQWTQRWGRLRAEADTLGNRRSHARPRGGFEKPHIRALARHQALRKHESSLLIQIRTGKIGLRAFLFEIRVPDIVTPQRRCGGAPETVAHPLPHCPELDGPHLELQH